MQADAATLENSMEVPQKTKKRTTLQPSNCTTRYLSKGYRSAVSKGHMHPNVYSSTIDNSQSMERVQMSIDGWMDKEDVVYIYTQRSITRQSKEWNLAICNSVYYYAKQSQSEKDKYMVSLMWNLRNKIDEHSRKKGKRKYKHKGRQTIRDP